MDVTPFDKSDTDDELRGEILRAEERLERGWGDRGIQNGIIREAQAELDRRSERVRGIANLMGYEL